MAATFLFTAPILSSHMQAQHTTPHRCIRAFPERVSRVLSSLDESLLYSSSDWKEKSYPTYLQLSYRQGALNMSALLLLSQEFQLIVPHPIAFWDKEPALSFSREALNQNLHVERKTVVFLHSLNGFWKTKTKTWKHIYCRWSQNKLVLNRLHSAIQKS